MGRRRLLVLVTALILTLPAAAQEAPTAGKMVWDVTRRCWRLKDTAGAQCGVRFDVARRSFVGEAPPQAVPAAADAPRAAGGDPLASDLAQIDDLRRNTGFERLSGLNRLISGATQGVLPEGLVAPRPASLAGQGAPPPAAGTASAGNAAAEQQALQILQSLQQGGGPFVVLPQSR